MYRLRRNDADYFVISDAARFTHSDVMFAKITWAKPIHHKRKRHHYEVTSLAEGKHRSKKHLLSQVLFCGAGNRTRTGTPVTARDFKSLVSTYSTMPAWDYPTTFSFFRQVIPMPLCLHTFFVVFTQNAVDFSYGVVYHGYVNMVRISAEIPLLLNKGAIDS